MTTGWTIYEPMFTCEVCGKKTRYKLGCPECQEAIAQAPFNLTDSIEMLRIS